MSLGGSLSARGAPRGEEKRLGDGEGGRKRAVVGERGGGVKSGRQGNGGARDAWESGAPRSARKQRATSAPRQRSERKTPWVSDGVKEIELKKLQAEKRKLALQLLDAERKLASANARAGSGGAGAGGGTGSVLASGSAAAGGQARRKEEGSEMDGARDVFGTVSAREGRAARSSQEPSDDGEDEAIPSSARGGAGSGAVSRGDDGSRRGRDRKASPPPFVGPKGVYKEPKLIGVWGGMTTATDSPGEKGYAISKTGVCCGHTSMRLERSNITCCNH